MNGIYRRNLTVPFGNSWFMVFCWMNKWGWQIIPTKELLNHPKEDKYSNTNYLLLLSRVLGNSTDSISNNPIIVPEKLLMQKINNLFVNLHSQKIEVFTSEAINTIKKQIPEGTAKLINSLPSTKNVSLPDELPLFSDMPVILTKNISTEQETTCIVRSIGQWDYWYC